MTTFLFWNLDRKDLSTSIARLVIRHRVDVLLLAECSLAPAALLTTLNGVAPDGSGEFFFSPGERERIAVYTRFPDEFLREVYHAPRFTIRELRLPVGESVLVVAVHLGSKVSKSEASQQSECWELSLAIRDAEESAGHRRTLVVGDLNRNPFDAGVVDANGLHAVMDRRIALRGSRTVNEKEHPFFYNPMWGLLGDATPGPPGTHYFNRGEEVTYFWNMLDQVLLRPDLLPRFKNDGLQILEGDGGTTFLTKGGLPSESLGSDHLPLLFELSA